MNREGKEYMRILKARMGTEPFIDLKPKWLFSFPHPRKKIQSDRKLLLEIRSLSGDLLLRRLRKSDKTERLLGSSRKCVPSLDQDYRKITHVIHNLRITISKRHVEKSNNANVLKNSTII